MSTHWPCVRISTHQISLFALIDLPFGDFISISALFGLLPSSLFTIDDSVLAPSLSTHTLPACWLPLSLSLSLSLSHSNTPLVPTAMWAIHAMQERAIQLAAAEFPARDFQGAIN